MIDTDISLNMIDGVLNPDYYKQASIDIINRTKDEYNYPDKLTSNNMLACLRQCYHALFKPEKNIYCNNKCNIPYTPENIRTLYDVYIELCELFSVLPSNYGFYRYTGIKEDTLLKYVTTAGLETTKTRSILVQNKLYESPIGVTVLANNDQDTGLLYNRQNMIERESIRHELTLNDFVKISQNNDK